MSDPKSSGSSTSSAERVDFDLDLKERRRWSTTRTVRVAKDGVVPAITASEIGWNGEGAPLVVHVNQRGETIEKTGVTTAIRAVQSDMTSMVVYLRSGWTDDRMVRPDGISPTLLGKNHDKSHLTGHTHAIPILVPYSDASGTATSTRRPRRSTTKTSKKTGSQLTLGMSVLNPYQTLISYARDFLANPSRWLADGWGFRTLGAHSSLRLLGLLRSNDLGYCSLKTSKGSSATTKGEPSGRFLPLWMNWGTMRNGKCLTASISESRRTGSVSLLSDILEENPGEKYFLSEKAIARIMQRLENYAKGASGKYHAKLLVQSTPDTELKGARVKRT